MNRSISTTRFVIWRFHEIPRLSVVRYFDWLCNVVMHFSNPCISSSTSAVHYIPADAWINEELCRFVLNEDVNGLVYKTLTAIHTLIPAAFLQRGGGQGPRSKSFAGPPRSAPFLYAKMRRSANISSRSINLALPRSLISFWAPTKYLLCLQYAWIGGVSNTQKVGGHYKCSGAKTEVHMRV